MEKIEKKRSPRIKKKSSLHRKNRNQKKKMATTTRADNQRWSDQLYKKLRYNMPVMKSFFDQLPLMIVKNRYHVYCMEYHSKENYTLSTLIKKRHSDAHSFFDFAPPERTVEATERAFVEHLGIEKGSLSQDDITRLTTFLFVNEHQLDLFLNDPNKTRVVNVIRPLVRRKGLHLSEGKMPFDVLLKIGGDKAYLFTPNDSLVSTFDLFYNRKMEIYKAHIYITDDAIYVKKGDGYAAFFHDDPSNAKYAEFVLADIVAWVYDNDAPPIDMMMVSTSGHHETHHPGTDYAPGLSLTSYDDLFT